MPKENERKVIVVVGDRAVGKSKLVQRLVEEPCSFDKYTPTIDECYNVVWKLPDNSYLQVQVIDTAGWNEFPAMQSLFIKMAHLVLLVYDVTRIGWNKTLLNTIAEIREVKDHTDILAIGNKCDSLTLENNYSATKIHNILIDSLLVGHVCVSARTELGIEGLKQMILCSESRLTLGHYKSLCYTPKRKKLKKSRGGILIRLASLLKSKRRNHTSKSDIQFPQDMRLQTNRINGSAAKQMSTFTPSEQSYDALFTAAQTNPIKGLNDPKSVFARYSGRRRGSLDVQVNTRPTFRADRECSQSLASLLEDQYYDTTSSSSLSCGSAETTSNPFLDEGLWTEQGKHLERSGSLETPSDANKQPINTPEPECYGTPANHYRNNNNQRPTYNKHKAPLRNQSYEDILSEPTSPAEIRLRLMSEGSTNLRGNITVYVGENRFSNLSGIK